MPLSRSLQSAFDVVAAASNSTSTSDLGSDIKPTTETISASANAAAAAAELLTPSEGPQLYSATETAAAVEEIEMSELRAGEETGMERGKSESLSYPYGK